MCTANEDVEFLCNISHMNVLNQSFRMTHCHLWWTCLDALMSLTSVLILSNSVFRNHICFRDITSLRTLPPVAYEFQSGTFSLDIKTLSHSLLQCPTTFRQLLHLLTDTSARYCTTSSIYQHRLNSVIVSAVSAPCQRACFLTYDSVHFEVLI